MRSKYVWLRNFTSLLLLFGYLLNVISFESFHQVVHNHDHAELHTVEAEADACHRAIYHGETSHECEHENHVANTKVDCNFCKVLTSRSSDFLSNNKLEYYLSNVKTHDVFHGPGVVLETFVLLKFLRGPPIS